MGLENWKTRKLSKRELLLSPFKHFMQEPNPDDPKTSRNNKLVEGIGEALSCACILYVALKGSQDQLVSYEIGSESKIKDFPQFPQVVTSLEQLNQTVVPINEQLNRLDRIWTGAYEDTVCLPVTSTSVDSDGDVTTTTTIQCHSEWNEPSKLTSVGLTHSRIGGWEGSLLSVQNQVGEVQTQSLQAFDLSNDGSALFYREKAVDTGGQAALALLAYGAIGGLFCLYEEGVSHVTSDTYSDEPLIDDRKYIKRRTLFKLMAAGLLSFKIRDIQRAFVGENENLLNDIKANTRQVLARMNVGPEENFRRFFGTNPKSIRDYLIDIKEKTSAALDSGYSGFLDGDWGRVKAEIEKTNLHAISSLSSFDKYFSYKEGQGAYTIPSDLTTATKYIWGTREITKFASSQSSRIYTRHLTDALGMALGLGLLAFIGEKALFPLMDKVKNAVGSNLDLVKS